MVQNCFSEPNFVPKDYKQWYKCTRLFKRFQIFYCLLIFISYNSIVILDNDFSTSLKCGKLLCNIHKAIIHKTTFKTFTVFYVISTKHLCRFFQVVQKWAFGTDLKSTLYHFLYQLFDFVWHRPLCSCSLPYFTK